MTVGGEQYNRAWRLRVGGVSIEALDIAFSVKRTLKREPNTAKIDVYNMAPATRALISGKPSLDVALEAGFVGRMGLLYLGQVRGAVNAIERPEIITTIETGDGEKALRKGHISVPVGPSMPIDQVLRLIARALGVKPGNLDAAAARLRAGGRTLYPVDTVLHGNAAQTLDDFCRAAGIEWSIQNGGLQLVDRGKAIASKPFVLQAESGLIGSPTIDGEGKLDVTCELNPELRPGLPILVNARFVKGLFRIVEIEYAGDTAGDTWDCVIKGERIKT